MSKEVIKLKLHELIDQLEDIVALQKLYVDALEFKYSWIEDDPISEETWADIDEGLAQIRNEEPCTHEEAIEKFRGWLLRK